MIRVHILSMTLLGALASGCYDNGEKTDCVGLSCGPGLEWPDGGEASIRYVRYPDGTEWRALIAFFIDQQSPEIITQGELNKCAMEPSFANVDSRRFYDVGESVTFNMGGESVVVPRVTGEQAVDFTTRQFEVAYLLETYEPTTPEFFNNSHSVTADDGSMPVTIDSIYMPPKLDILAPLPEGTSGMVTIQRGKELVVEWKEVEPPPVEISTAAAIFFLDLSQSSYPIVCFSLNSGRFVVPADIVDQIPANGLLQAGTVANEAVLTPDGRRIDTWGTNCSAVPYTTVN